MTKIKTILTTIGVLTMGLTLNGYAMMGGDNGHGTYRDSGHGTYHRTDHVITYNMAPGYYGYYNQGAHMSDEEMAYSHSRRYSPDRNMVNGSNYYRLHLEFNQRNPRQGYGYNHNQNKTGRYPNER